MRILFISAILPYPLHSGGQVRIYHLLKTLAGKHDITLFSFIREEKEKGYYRELGFCRRIETVMRGRAWRIHYVARTIFGRYPFLLTTYDSKTMRDAIGEELTRERYDLVHIEPGYVWPSIPKLRVPLVVAEHNIEYRIYQEFVARFPVPFLRPILYGDVLKLRYWEEKIWNEANAVVSVSEDDRRVIEERVPKAQVRVVSNGVSLGDFPYAPRNVHKTHAPVFLFVGNFAWLQNRDAVRYLLGRLWPEVSKKYRDATLRIVGRRMPRSLGMMLKQKNVRLLESVDEILPEYQRADILLAPIRIGGGTKFKILEAMASGVPVVTTSVGALGLEVTNGRELFIADDAESSLGAIDTILEDRKTRETLTRSARRLIEEKYSWETIAKNLENVWYEVRR